MTDLLPFGVPVEATRPCPNCGLPIRGAKEYQEHVHGTPEGLPGCTGRKRMAQTRIRLGKGGLES